MKTDELEKICDTIDRVCEEVQNDTYWRNRKTGNLYRVEGLANHSESEELMVVYHNVPQSEMWVRPALMWFDKFEAVQVKC